MKLARYLATGLCRGAPRIAGTGALLGVVLLSLVLGGTWVLY